MSLPSVLRKLFLGLLTGLHILSQGAGALAQQLADLEAFKAHVVELHAQGKYREAATLAEQHLKTYLAAHGEHHPSVAWAIGWLGHSYQALGRYAEAEPLVSRALNLAEALLGPNHPDVATALDAVAALSIKLGKFKDAETRYRRSLDIREKTLAPGDPTLGTGLDNLAVLLETLGRYAEAEHLYKRALGIREAALGSEHTDVAQSLNNFAALLVSQGRLAEAEPIYQRALSIHRKLHGSSNPDIATTLNNLAALYHSLGRLTEAETLHKNAWAMRVMTLGAEHPDVANSLHNLATLHRAQGRYADAEALYKRAIEIREKAQGYEHPSVADSLKSLADLYMTLDLRAAAEPLSSRALAIFQKSFGPGHPTAIYMLNDLAALSHHLGRHSQALELMEQALATSLRIFGPEHVDVSSALSNLAFVQVLQARYPEAESNFKRAIAIREKALAADHPDIASLLSHLADLYQYLQRYSEAAPLYAKALSIREKALGPDHPDVSASLNNFARLHLAQQDFISAINFWRRSTDIAARRMQLSTKSNPAPTHFQAASHAYRPTDQFFMLAKLLYALASSNAADKAPLADEAFLKAQWALDSPAATSLSQMASRGARANPALAALARERQDLLGEWAKRDAIRTTALTLQPDGRQTQSTFEAHNRSRISGIEARIADIDNHLKREFPDFAALASPLPLSIQDVQAELRPHEALLLVFPTPAIAPLREETLIWVVTKTDQRWVRSDWGSETLSREIQALRCSLDAGNSQSAGCRELTGFHYSARDRQAGRLPPFDYFRAHVLYRALFDKVTDLIDGKHLILVPSGPLTRLPLHVLIAEPPHTNPLSLLRAHNPGIVWLARKHAITVLPAVSSLKALRRVGRPSNAPLPMVGFGNPLLDGSGSAHADLATKARAIHRCAETRLPRFASTMAMRSNARSVAMRGGYADAAVLRAQLPLPETADELCAVARAVGAEPDHIFLGARATETEVKSLSARGTLAQYRIVHFATHGVLPGQLANAAEPGLILTPPDKPSEHDDGYLTASEIAELKLDADWVILSACNTAAGTSSDTEALSGLARAFFYAQARALLVSHWEVDSLASEKLITTAVRELANNPEIGRSEALRRAMNSLIDSASPHDSHPATWGPFVVVGEGAPNQ